MPKSKRIPVCQTNGCGVDKIRFNNVCTKLENYEACEQPSKGIKSHSLQVNPTTLELYCVLLTPSRFTPDDDVHEGNDCFLGGKRSQNGMCSTT